MGGQDLSFQVPITATVTAVSQTFDLSSSNTATEIIQVIGTWVGTIVIEGSNDGTNYLPIDMTNRVTHLIVNSITANGSFQANTNGLQYIRARSSAWTSGTANMFVWGSDATSLVSTDSLLRGGSNGTQIGNVVDALKVTVGDGTNAVSVSTNNDFGVADGLSNGGVNGNLALTTGGTAYEAKVGGSRLALRKSLSITALDDLYWGYSNSVTTANGTPLYKNQNIIFSIDPGSSFQVWLVAAGSSKNARITESP